MHSYSAAIAALLAASALVPAHAALPPAPAATLLVTAPVDDAVLAPLTGTVTPRARKATDLGALAAGTPIAHMRLWLNRPAARQAALDELTAQQVQSGSPYYRQWLTPADLGRDYGPAAADIAAASGWLSRHGFTINGVTPTGTAIDFSGTAAQLAAAFHTTLHTLRTGTQLNTANLSEPAIPAALKALVQGIRLNNFAPDPQFVARGTVSKTAGKPGWQLQRTQGDLTIGNPNGGNYYIVTPADFDTIYGVPGTSSGVSQAGIGVVENSDMEIPDFNTFEKAMLGSNYNKASVSHPGGCNDPGLYFFSEEEAALDAEWAGGVVRGDKIDIAACANSTTSDGVATSFENLVEYGTKDFILSISFGACEQNLGLVFLQRWLNLTQEAAAEGLTVVVSSGDNGPAACENIAIDILDGSAASTGLAVNGLAASPYVTAVGGTDFDDTARNQIAKYWNTTPDATYLYQPSALSYIPEIPWEDNCVSPVLTQFDKLPKSPFGVCTSSTAFGQSLFPPIAGSSGTSGYYKRPSWQVAQGLPTTPFRTIPDVSLFAADGLWNHFLLFCDTGPYGTQGAPCTHDASGISGYIGAGGTSFSAPAFASVMAGNFFDGHGNTPVGNIGPILYTMARAQFSSKQTEAACGAHNGAHSDTLCIFHSVDRGSNAVACNAGSPNCRADGSYSFGVLSSTKGPAFPGSLYYSQATGLGSLNVTNFLINFP